jgi:quinol monooxygenase YgiN
MIIRVVRMTFHAEEVDRFRTLFAGWAPRIRSSPGCRYLELWRDTSDPCVFFTHSHWDGPEDLERYRTSAVFAEVWPVVKGLFSAPAMAWSVDLEYRSDTPSPIGTVLS